MPEIDTTRDVSFWDVKCSGWPITDRGYAPAPGNGKVILLVEPKTESADRLQVALETGTGWRALISEEGDDALATASALKSRLKIALITTDRKFDGALRFVRDLKELAVANRFDCPHILILSRVSLGPEAASMFEKLGAEYLLRQYLEPTLEAVRKISWQVRKAQSLPNIVLYRRGGHITKVEAISGSVKGTLKIGPRLRELLESFALHMHTEVSTAMIADWLGICIRSPKQYLQLLRNAWNRAFQDQPVTLTGEEVFVTRRIPGGHVHRVHAHFEIVDGAEF